MTNLVIQLSINHTHRLADRTLTLFSLVLIIAVGLLPGPVSATRDSKTVVISDAAFGSYVVRVDFSSSGLHHRGSGIYLIRNGSVFFVTARHVLFNTDSVTGTISFKGDSATLTSSSSAIADSTQLIMRLSLNVLAVNHDLVLWSNADVAAIRIGTWYTNGAIEFVKGIHAVGVPKFAPLAINEEGYYPCDSISAGAFVVATGYPIHSDSVTINNDLRIDTGRILQVDYLSRRFFMSSDVTFGMSGGPVFGSTAPLESATSLKLIGLVLGFNDNDPNRLYSGAICIETIFRLIDDGWK